METIIKDIEYNVPLPDRPVGSLSFSVEQLILFKEGRQVPREAAAADVVLSEKTVGLLSQLTESIIEDLAK